ncbi:hypothetical protein SYNPS1DRAFT_25850 [Syncephalis pseudoplumigaleata]|uniref:DUF2470 domain-containing protein n=1 Tax=Syncephalis pseudoplumigaleata TaxID=1712513 RepID=A0A4P9YRG9_9FUNG|nr:hypothetical protein SYNPS1DRAFT_25850 [Syncephalis pseudoplumigaleata]|eukprot:RKP22417.1 hypothetical protein SYNPS1DRAFT_25850 [Syncephalis pseudoplumigaleata]
MSPTSRTEQAPSTAFAQQLTKTYANELPHLVSAITYRASVSDVAVASVDGHRLVLSYRHQSTDDNDDGSTATPRTCAIDILPKSRRHTRIYEDEQAQAIAQLMKKVKPPSTKPRQRYIDYFQVAPRPVLIGILLLCAYLTILKNTPAAMRPGQFQYMYDLLGERFITFNYYFMISVHAMESFTAFLVCRHRRYSLPTTLSWMLQTFFIGYPGFRGMFSPRPAIK